MRVFTSIVFVLASLSLSAASYRVDNNASNNADFTSLQEAHDAVSAGDTLYVAGSAVGYAELTITKKIYVIGTGYFLSENAETQADFNSSKTVALRLNEGSDGSIVQGLEIFGIVEIQAPNIVFRRNKVEVDAFSLLNILSSSVIVMQNYLYQTGAVSNYACIRFGGGLNNIVVQNNYISTHSYYAIEMWNTNSGAEIRNNIINGGDPRINNSTFVNNIQVVGYFHQQGNNFVANNIGNGDQFGSENNNQSNIDMSTVFVGSGSPDGQWQLKAGSPALNAGINGEDCGMFGGDDAYILSGLPNIPAIYFFNAPTSGSLSNGLPVQIKVKSHN